LGIEIESVAETLLSVRFPLLPQLLIDLVLELELVLVLNEMVLVLVLEKIGSSTSTSSAGLSTSTAGAEYEHEYEHEHEHESESESERLGLVRRLWRGMAAKVWLMLDAMLGIWKGPGAKSDRESEVFDPRGWESLRLEGIAIGPEAGAILPSKSEAGPSGPAPRRECDNERWRSECSHGYNS
jgi:hypothetical protein